MLAWAESKCTVKMGLQDLEPNPDEEAAREWAKSKEWGLLDAPLGTSPSHPVQHIPMEYKWLLSAYDWCCGKAEF